MAEPAQRNITIELACALAERQWLLRLAVRPGTTVRAAVLGSELAAQCPEIDFAHCALGIWGEPVADDRVLVEGDRIEVYRPLRMDPREARRVLAARGLTMGPVNRSGG